MEEEHSIANEMDFAQFRGSEKETADLWRSIQQDLILITKFVVDSTGALCPGSSSSSAVLYKKNLKRHGKKETMKV